jgi:ribosomal protein S17
MVQTMMPPSAMVVESAVVMKAPAKTAAVSTAGKRHSACRNRENRHKKLLHVHFTYFFHASCTIG